MLRRLAVVGAVCALAAGSAAGQTKLSVSEAETRDVASGESAPEAAGFRDPAWQAVEKRYRGLMEGMKREIALMAQLKDAQELLLMHNRGREVLGGDMAALPPALCVHEQLRVWCAVLPATFGRLR